MGDYNGHVATVFGLTARSGLQHGMDSRIGDYFTGHIATVFGLAVRYGLQHGWNIYKWLGNHKDVNITVTGYADVQTGNKTINWDLSQRRANKVKAYLVGKGIDASRITVDYKGDREQPFTQNDLNRCVISTLK